MNKSIGLVGIALLTLMTGCEHQEPLRPEPGTKWESQEGYSVELGSTDTYTFCDNQACFRGKFTRPGGPDSIAILLKDFYRHPETERFQERLVSLGSEHSAIRISYPDLDFTETGGRAPEKWCSDKPCVLFGSVTTPDHLIFYKR